MCDCEDTTINCCGGMMLHRRYLTRSEEIEQLKNYKQALESEIRGVEEQIEKLST